MSMQIVLYRLYRLRRLLVVAAVPPLLVWLVIFALKGPAAWALLPFALLPTTLHVLRYPNIWNETMAVSVTTVVVLALAGTISANVGIAGLALRVAGLGLLAFLVFMVAVAVLPFKLMGGPESKRTYSARATSHLDVPTLKERITYYPGRKDERVECGPEREDGVFEITLKHRMVAFDCGMGQISAEDLEDDEELQDFVLPEPDENGEIPFDITMYAVVLQSTEDCHDVVFIEEGSKETTTTRHRFRAGRKGTHVELTETGAPMSTGMHFGFWVQDYMADHLTDEIARAEGRDSPANRFQSQGQLVVDIAKWFVPRTLGVRPSE